MRIVVAYNVSMGGPALNMYTSIYYTNRVPSNDIRLLDVLSRESIHPARFQCVHVLYFVWDRIVILPYVTMRLIKAALA